MISFDVSSFDLMSKRLSKASQAVEKGSLELMRLSTLMVQGKAQENAPVDKSTLRKSIQKSYTSTEGIVGSNLPYAKYQEFGTGIYGPRGTPITPKRGNFLAFQTKSGQWIRTRSVRGVQPKLFLFNALEYLKKNIDQVKDLAAKMVVKSL